MRSGGGQRWLPGWQTEDRVEIWNLLVAWPGGDLGRGSNTAIKAEENARGKRLERNVWKIHRPRCLCLILRRREVNNGLRPKGLFAGEKANATTVRLDSPPQLDQSIRCVASGRKEAPDQTISIIIPRARDRAQWKGRGLAGDVTLVAVVNLQVVWVSWRPGRSVSKFQPVGRLRPRSGRTLSPSIAERGRAT